MNVLSGAITPRLHCGEDTDEYTGAETAGLSGAITSRLHCGGLIAAAGLIVWGWLSGAITSRLHCGFVISVEVRPSGPASPGRSRPGSIAATAGRGT